MTEKASEAAEDVPSEQTQSLSTQQHDSDWSEFYNWMHCFCVVTFDLELGQALEFLYPPEAWLSDKEKTGICYLSFPDSNASLLGDIQYFFRFRRSARLAPLALCEAQTNYNANTAPGLTADPGYLYGYVYFRQVKDRTVPRGYLQKSVVLISPLPMISLLAHVVQVVGLEYFESGQVSIESACHNINRWPRPVPGDNLQLPLHGQIIQMRIPSRHDRPLSPSKDLLSHAMSKQGACFPSPIVLPSVQEMNLYSWLLPVLPHLQLLWELVMLNEPIVVMAPSPTMSSEFVRCLLSLIWPLKYCSDFRPYFTIHDSEFKEFTTKTQAPPSVILGVTNPFFAKTFQHWPHVVRVSGEPIPFGRVGESGSAGSSPSGGVAGRLGGKPGSLKSKTIDGKPGLQTRYCCFLHKDKVFLKRLFKGLHSKRPAEVQSILIRRHFVELSQSFMIPLERHLASLMPLQRYISPLKATPRARSFDPDEFLATVHAAGPHLTSGLRGDWIGLYKRFFESPNFHGWLEYRLQEINHKLELLHLETMCNADLVSCVRGRSEIELIDFVLRLKEKQQFIEQNCDGIRTELQYKLQAQLSAVTSLLSQDLRDMLLGAAIAPSPSKPALNA